MTVFGRGLGHALESLAATNSMSWDWIGPSIPKMHVVVSVVTCASGKSRSVCFVRRCCLFSQIMSTHTKHRYGTREFEKEKSAIRFTQRHIANLGHGMHPTHDPEMAGEFIKAVQEESLKMRKNE